MIQSAERRKPSARRRKARGGDSSEASGGPRPASVRRALESMEKALASRLLYDDPGHPSYVRALDRVRSSLDEVLVSAPDGVAVRLENGLVRWHGFTVLGGKRPSRLYAALHGNGVTELRLLAPPISDELGELLESIHLLGSPNGAAVAAGNLMAALSFVSLDGPRFAAGPDAADSAVGESPDDGDVAWGDEPGGSGDAPQAAQAADDGAPDEGGALEEAAGDESTGPEAAAGPDEDEEPEAMDPQLVIDAEDRAALDEQIRGEAERDVAHDVATALLDTMEASDGRWRDDVLEHLPRFLNNVLSDGRIDLAVYVLRELRRATADLDRHEVERVERVSEIVARGDGLRAVVAGQTAESWRADAAELADLVMLLAPASLLAALELSVRATRPQIRARLFQAASNIAAGHPTMLLEGFDPALEPQVIQAALRLAGRIDVEGAGPYLEALLDDERPVVRLAAVEASGKLGSPSVLDRLARLLDDADREVRVRAARALGRSRFRPARERFAQLVTGPRIRAADLSEKQTFFESYGRIAGPQDVELLDRLLNGKRFLLLHESPEIRGCAALALGHVRNDAALGALVRARTGATHPVVRSAVRRALVEADRRLSA